jgi:hypothetical protein
VAAFRRLHSPAARFCWASAHVHTHVACDVPPHTGPLPPLQRRRRKQTGSAGADGEVEEDADSQTCATQAHGQELWLDRQRRQCEQSIEEAATRERGKVAGPLLELERKKWRREFDQQIQRTRQDAEEECEKLQREHRRNLTICNLTIADLRYAA